MLDINHDFPFDPRYGYDLEQLQSVDIPNTEAHDFSEFWEGLYRQTRAVDVQLVRKHSQHTHQHVHVEELYFQTLDGVRIGAWLVTPIHKKVRSIRVIGHGYGGRQEPSMEGPEIDDDMAVLFPCAPGFDLSAASDIPYNDAGRHVIHGIESRETYVFRSCVASLWSAASVLIDLFPDCAQTLTYIGGSYGGGMGIMMLPWDNRYQRAEVSVPSFGHYPIRLQCQGVGSGESVRHYHASHPEIESVLAYFDAVTHATKINVPVLLVVCLFDPAVPPPGQFAIANAVPGEKIILIKEAGHFTFEGPVFDEQEIQHQKQSQQFFAVT